MRQLCLCMYDDSEVWCVDPGNVLHAVRQTVVGQKHPLTGLFGTPTDRTVWNTHRPDCLEHPDCRCSRQSGTPTDRTVSVRLSTMLQLRRRTSLRGRSDVTRCPLWHPRCLERLRLHLRLYVILAFNRRRGERSLRSLLVTAKFSFKTEKIELQSIKPNSCASFWCNTRPAPPHTLHYDGSCVLSDRPSMPTLCYDTAFNAVDRFVDNS